MVPMKNEHVRLQIVKLMLNLTFEERLEMAATEMENLVQITEAQPFKRSMVEDVEDREYRRAKQKARGDWEPQDAPGWEGGFAPNH